MTDTALRIETATPTHGVGLTDAAAAKVKSLLMQEGRDDLRLRLAVHQEDRTAKVRRRHDP